MPTPRSLYPFEFPKQKRNKLIEGLKEYRGLKTKLTFSFPLNRTRKEILKMIAEGKIKEEIIIKLLESSDFIEKKIGLFLLKQPHSFSNKGYPKIISILEKMKDDEDMYVRAAVAEALGNLGKKGLSILKKMKNDEEWYVRIAVSKALGNFKKKNLPFLERIIQDEDLDIPTELGEMFNDLIKKFLLIFKKEKGYKWLLASQKPLFATVFTRELAERILKIQKIVEKLKKEFKDEFIGIIVFGSTHKGYFMPGSDLDWAIITQNPKCAEEFKKISKSENLDLCYEHKIIVNKEYQLDNFSIFLAVVLFQGLFWGDYEKLKKIQSNFLKNIDEKKWDKIRRRIMENETKLSKAAERLNLKKDEIERIELASSILRVPPSYKEALELFK